MSEPMRSITIKCPMCSEAIHLDLDVVVDATGTRDGTILARLDRTPADEHVKKCPGRVQLPAANLPAKVKVDLEHPAIKARLKGRIDVFLDQRHYMAKGKRACTMCGAANEDCAVTLEKRAEACCPGCHNGDTHPVPGADQSCAEWATVHGAKE